MSEEEIETFNAIKDLPIIQQYTDLLYKVVAFNDKKPKEKYYKSSQLRDYYIEMPYDRLTLDNEGKYYIKKCNYSYNGKRKDKSSTLYGCLSYCNYSLKEIKEMIDKSIEKDNLELLGDKE